MTENNSVELTKVMSGAVDRLRGTAWVCAWVLVFSCWVLSFGVSSYLSNIVGKEAVLISLMGVLLSSFMFFDVLIRLSHCQDSKGFGKRFCEKLTNEQSFRAVPTHLIDNGDQLADSSVECWLRDEVYDVPEAQQLAKQYRKKAGVLRIADAVNLKIFADLTRRRLSAGCLSA